MRERKVFEIRDCYNVIKRKCFSHPKLFNVILIIDVVRHKIFVTLRRLNFQGGWRANIRSVLLRAFTLDLKQNLVEVNEPPRYIEPLLFDQITPILVWNNGLHSLTDREQLIVPVPDLVEVEEQTQSESDEVSECVICLCPVGQSDEGRVLSLSCNTLHRFCALCIITWYEQNETCPICRATSVAYIE